MEQITGNGQMEKKKNKRNDPPCCIRIHSLRNRLADSDGISGKAAIDGLVHCGILEDDSATFVKEVRFSQEKTIGNEKTIITIEFI